MIRLPSRVIRWMPVAGSTGYHVYRSRTDQLPDYGECLVGSVRGTTTAIPEHPAIGVAF